MANMRIILSLIFMTLIYSAMSFADDASSDLVLAVVNVKVADRSPSELDKGLQTAFVQEATRLSRNPKVMASARMQDAAKAVKLWVESYRYVSDPQSSALMLEVTFNPVAMKKLLAENNGVVNAQIIESDKHPTEEKLIGIVVKNIQDARDFREVVSALQGIKGVDRVSTEGLQGDSVRVTVYYTGDVPRFENMITEDHRFKTSSTQLEYEWAGREP
jgi:hypothetical protein